MKMWSGFALVIVFLSKTADVRGQCSDAGVCLIGKKTPSLRHQIGISYNLGKSGKADNLTFHSFQLEANIQVFHTSNISFSFPWSRQSGPLGTASGIGDLSVLWSEAVVTEQDRQVTIEIGGKLATGVVDAKVLPQSYQPGLGTNDIIVGASYAERSWSGALGYQFSPGRSDNTVTLLHRGDDVFARVGYSGNLNEFNAGFEVLAIKRLKESTVLDRSPSGDNFVSVRGSDQFQVNILGRVVFPFDESKNLRLFGAMPLLQRKVNVDGLTRSFTLSLGLLLAL